MKYITLAFCVVMGILSYIGIWKPNKFGTGTLWLTVGFMSLAIIQ
jgi:hypothetical protein